MIPPTLLDIRPVWPLRRPPLSLSPASRCSRVGAWQFERDIGAFSLAQDSLVLDMCAAPGSKTIQVCYVYAAWYVFFWY